MLDKIAVVTGGAGFIGSHMVDLLIDRGFKVRVIDNFSGGHEKNLIKHKDNIKLEIYNEDIRYLSSESKIFKKANVVFHFAGIGDIVPSIEKPTEYAHTLSSSSLRSKYLKTARQPQSSASWLCVPITFLPERLPWLMWSQVLPLLPTSRGPMWLVLYLPPDTRAML